MMSKRELTLHKIEQVRLGFPHSEALNQICDYARRTHDAEKRAEQAEAEAAELRRALSHATEMVGELDEARQEAAHLRSVIKDCEAWANHPRHVRQIAHDALQSAPPASEPEKCPHCSRPLLPVDNVPYCEHCDYSSTDPAPADRPEPSEALRLFETYRERVMLANTYERQELEAKIRQALSQPAPAVPDAVRRLPEKWRNEIGEPEGFSETAAFEINSVADELERALAAQPSESPAVPNVHRWNFKQREDGLYACRHLHGKHEECEYERVTEVFMRRHFAAAPDPTGSE